jgi:pyrophosphatase PpaX
MPGLPRLADYCAVLFDVDGTLVNSLLPVITGLQEVVLRETGVRPAEDQVQSLIGKPIREQHRTLIRPDLSDAELDRLQEETVALFEANSHMETWYEPMLDVFREVHGAGKQTALVTSKTRVELELFMKRFPCSPITDATVSSSDVPHPKPAPDSALAAAELLGVSPQQCVFMGDSIYDIRCAHSAGMPAVALSFGAGRRDALAKENPELLFDTPEQALEWARSTLTVEPCPAGKP